MIRKTNKLLAIALILIMLMQTNVFAVDKVGFSDIDENNQYYQEIEELHESGYVSGKGDNKFHPEDIISYGEYLTILHRIYSDYNEDLMGLNINVENKHWAYPVVLDLIAHNIVSYSEVGELDLNEQIPFEYAIKPLLQALGVTKLTESEYLSNSFTNTNSAIILNGYHIGLIPDAISKEIKADSKITRAEAAGILSNFKKLLSKEESIQAPLPEILKDINIKFIGENSETHYNKAAEAISLFPIEIIEQLKKDGYEIIITAEPQSKYIPDVEVGAAGVTIEDTKQIIIFTEGKRDALYYNILLTLCHEIGHYIWAEVLEQSDRNIIEQSYKSEELNTFVEVINRDYAKSNIYEYFAELVANSVIPYTSSGVKDSGIETALSIMYKYNLIK